MSPFFEAVSVISGDRVRLHDGLVHLCNYTRGDNRAHYACGIQCTPNIFDKPDVNKGPVTCLQCCAGEWYLR